MALIEILPDTNPTMRKTSRRVRHVDDNFRKLVEDMYETMVENWGIGLSAVQVGVLKRFFIYEIPKRPPLEYETSPPENKDDNQTDMNGDPAGEVDQDADDSHEDKPPELGYTGEYMVCINPKIISMEGKIIDEEGCLSKVGWVAKVERAYKITFQAYDLDMRKFERTVEGMEARCVLHETDHLDGILFTDRAIPETLREITDDECEAEDEQSSEKTEDVEVGAE